MIRYLADRLWQSLLVLAVMSFVIYGLIGLMPGDPINFMISADPRLSSEDAARLKEVYGLDRPLLDRYLGRSAVISATPGCRHARCWRRWHPLSATPPD